MNNTRIRRDTVVLIGCITITALAYLPSLANHLVADSWVFMMPHSFFDTFTYFFRTMLPPEHEAFWLRPVPMFTYWVDMALWPGTEWGPHVINIMFHLFNVWLVWLLIRIMQSRPSKLQTKPDMYLPALTASLIYGLHPLTVGSVAWVAARFDVMSVTFGLSALVMWLKWDSGNSKRRYLFWSFLLLLLSILSKEQGIVFSATCFLMSISRMVISPDKRKRNLISLIILGLMAGGYILYRLAVFKGLGGYVSAEHGLSIRPPFYYLLAIFFPYLNVIPGWSFSWSFAATTFVITAIGFYLWRTPWHKGGRIPRQYLIFAAGLCAFGLATNAPNPGMTLERILDHSESRFALNAIAGLSLLTGIVVDKAARSVRLSRVILVLTIIWGVTAAWRTDVQIQAWKDAGNKADTIIRDTLRMAPDPPQNSHLYYIDIPLNNDQWAYIFGIGLKEALLLKYKNRYDLTIVRYPKLDDMRRANPEKDFMFRYIKSTGKLEKLVATMKKKPDN